MFGCSYALLSLPAILDFNKSLAAKGIRLVLLPVPEKSLVRADKLFPPADWVRHPAEPSAGSMPLRQAPPMLIWCAALSSPALA